MLISDWSSDVCASDLVDVLVEVEHQVVGDDRVAGGEERDQALDQVPLGRAEPGLQVAGVEREVDLLHRPGVADGVAVHLVELRVAHRAKGEFEARVEQELAVVGGHMLVPVCLSPSPAQRERGWGRSEEHTSELQSLMRISYAVLCLK